MSGIRAKEKLSSHAGEFLAALLIIQPLLDVLSYFMQETGSTAITTALRMAMLAAVSLYGFAISDKKQLYAAMYGAMGSFWLLHTLNCVRVGYASPVQDAAEFLKLMQLPLWTASFVTLFRKQEGLDLRITGVLAANFAVILLIIGLSYITGKPEYTYDNPYREMQIGVMGWFASHNAQSAIVCLLTIALLLWGWRTGKLWVFCLCAASGMGLLFVTGTKLAYYAALILAAVFTVMILLSRRNRLFCVPLLLGIALLVAFRGFSPMAERSRASAESVTAYQQQIDGIMGGEKGFSGSSGQEIPPETMDRIRRVYQEVYGGPGLYGEPLLGDLLERFGTDRVMEALDYSVSPEVLNNARSRRLAAMDLLWEEKDFLTHLLGFEYGESFINGNPYDPENDFPALIYYYGYLGTALYAAFVAGVLGYGILAFFRKLPALFTVEYAAAAMMAVLGLGAGQLSGNVLRRPSVTVYVALAFAMLISLAQNAVPADRLRPGHERNPAVSLKKI